MDIYVATHVLAVYSLLIEANDFSMSPPPPPSDCSEHYSVNLSAVDLSCKKQCLANMIRVLR